MTTTVPTATVVICTFNGAGRIEASLTGIANQLNSTFQVLVVDNASTDGTAAAVEGSLWTRNLRGAGRAVRIVREERQGLLFARLRGLREATSDCVCFLDDDNVPEPLFVTNGIHAFEDPRIGLLTSRVVPKYARPPPPSILRREHLFAVNRSLGLLPIVWDPSDLLAPTLGAGMWLRRSAALQAIPIDHPEDLVTDRVGRLMISGGDIELGILIGRAGYSRRYEPACELIHLIPEHRLATRYFMRLVTGIVRSTATINDKYRIKRWTPLAQLIAGARLIACILALPIFAFRADSLREAAFALAARVADLVGPYKRRVLG